MTGELNYIAAVGLMVTSNKGSTSYIQRTLGLGYNAACRLVERMEDEGILARPNHVGKREVLVTAARIRELEAQLAASEAAARETALQYLSDAGQAADRYDALHGAVEALGAMPEGYCFCSSHRVGDGSKEHEPECRDLRAALSAHKGAEK